MRTQLCPVDGVDLDEHTEADMVSCERLLQDTGRLTLPAIRVKIHPSWHWTLPKRYQA